jgi:outer membrane protein assembly factor BamE (lipoprotein component of BamABCDE complex)
MRQGKIIKLTIASALVLLLVWHCAASIFVSERWKKSLLVANDTVRLEMVDDLLRRYKLVGMSRTELETLLGKPPPTAYFNNYDYVYWLGPERGFISIDSEWLCVKFKGDTVVEARICRD